MLADGMGGHTGGEVASKMAVDAFVATFNAYPAGSVPAKLGAALNGANNHLASGIKNAPALEGMGCTLVGIYCSRRPQIDRPCRLRIDQRLSSGGGSQSQIGTTCQMIKFESAETHLFLRCWRVACAQ